MLEVTLLTIPSLVPLFNKKAEKLNDLSKIFTTQWKNVGTGFESSISQPTFLCFIYFYVAQKDVWGESSWLNAKRSILLGVMSPW